MPGTSPLQQALQQAKRDGRPLLVVGARASCPLCQAFKKRLATDASLRPLLVNYSPVFCDSDSPAEKKELARLRPLGGTLPFLYIVRADGQVISATTNASANPNFPGLLRDGIAQSGIFLRPADVPKAEAALANAKAASEREDTSQALTLLAGLGVGRGDSFATVLVDARKLLEEIKNRAKQDIETVQRSMQDMDRLAAALLLVDAAHKYAKLPEEQKVLSGLMKEFKSNTEDKALLAQAEEVVKARGMARLNRKDRAAQTYEKLIKKYPESPVARLAQTERDALSQAKPADGATNSRQ